MTVDDDDRLRTVVFQIFVTQKELKSEAPGSIPTKTAKIGVMSSWKTLDFHKYLRFAIRTRFFSPPTDSIFEN